MIRNEVQVAIAHRRIALRSAHRARARPQALANICSRLPAGMAVFPEGTPGPRDAWRASWLRKKPTSETGKPWKSSKIDKRFYVTKGFRVDYYDKALTPGKEVEAAGWREVVPHGALAPATLRRPPAASCRK